MSCKDKVSETKTGRMLDFLSSQVNNMINNWAEITRMNMDNG